MAGTKQEHLIETRVCWTNLEKSESNKMKNVGWVGLPVEFGNTEGAETVPICRSIACHSFRIGSGLKPCAAVRSRADCALGALLLGARMLTNCPERRPQVIRLPVRDKTGSKMRIFVMARSAKELGKVRGSLRSHIPGSTAPISSLTGRTMEAYRVIRTVTETQPVVLPIVWATPFLLQTPITATARSWP